MRVATFVSVCAVGLFTQVAVGCSVYDASLVQGSGGGPGDALPAQVPARPVMSPLPDVADTPTFALRQVVLNQLLPEAIWDEIGVDLDRTNTVVGTVGRCEQQDVAATDGLEGIDNVFGQRFYPLLEAQLPVDPESAAREAHEAGDGTIVARMEGWNGTANDEQVSVTVVQAVDGTPEPPDSVYLDPATFELRRMVDDSLADPPAWAGSDNWWVRDDGFVPGDPTQPYQRDANAYIRDRVLVLRLKDRPIFFKMGEHAVQVVLRDAWVLATFNEDFSAVSDIVVSGRWSTLDLLATAGGVELCPGDPLREGLHTLAELYADVRANAAEDGMDLPCDAISLGVRFESGVLGNWEPSASTVAPGPSLPDYCSETADGGT